MAGISAASSGPIDQLFGQIDFWLGVLLVQSKSQRLPRFTVNLECVGKVLASDILSLGMVEEPTDVRDLVAGFVSE